MSTSLELAARFKGLALLAAIAGGLWITLHANSISIATVQEPAAKQRLAVDGQSREEGRLKNFSFCGLMISRINPLELKENETVCSNKNSILSLSKSAIRKIRVVITAYSSTVGQTDETPFLTANGTYVHDGVVANNGLPFGTQIRIPELFGEKVFSVEDRMHWRVGDHQFDIWFPTYEQAKNFGVRYAYVEVLEM